MIAPDHQLPGPVAPSRWSTAGKVIISVVVIAAFALVFVWVLRKHEAAQASNSSRRGGGGPVTITIATAWRGDIDLHIDSIGTVTPYYTDTITSQVTGIVSEVHFTEGQLVKKGDPLIEIDASPFQATLKQAEGILDRDQGLLDEAKMDLDRYQKAWARNAIQKQTLEDQEKLVVQDEGTVKNDKGTVEYDKIQVGYCHITAPITGKVGLRLVDPGNVIQLSGIQSSGNAPLAVITQLQPITVVFIIPEDSIDLVQEHMHDQKKLEVDVYDRSDQKKIETGELTTLDNQIDTTTGTVKARGQFPNTDGKLFPNQFVNTHLLVTTFHNATIIPSSAIQHNGNVSFVYVIQDNAAHMQNVTPGVTDGDVTQVEGIEPGDVLANSGFEKLQDKSKVTIVKEPGTEPTTGPTTGPTSRPHRHRQSSDGGEAS